MPVELTVERVDGTFKLNQNRTSDERASAATALEASDSPGMELRALAALMRQVGEKRPGLIASIARLVRRIGQVLAVRSSEVP